MPGAVNVPMSTAVSVWSDWLLPGMLRPRVVIVIIVITLTVRWSPGAAAPLDLGVFLGILAAGRQTAR